MKKLCMILAAVLLMGLCGCVVAGQGNWMEGVCLVTNNGRVLLIVEDEPIALSDRSKEGGLLEGVQTGDRVRVLHDGLAESFPAQAGIYKLVKTGEGSIDDISPKTLDMLRQLGWLD